MSPLAILILSDGRPGHYHLAEGVAAAIARRRPVTVTTVALARRKAAPGRMMAAALGMGFTGGTILRLGYGLPVAQLPPARLVISAGGDTLAANVAAARHLGARNIYCGTLKHMTHGAVSLVISSYARHAGLPHHLVALKPSGIDPDRLANRTQAAPFGPDRAPACAGLLIGGPSGLFQWRDDEWTRLTDFLQASHRASGTRWIVSTSRRTPDAVADGLQRMRDEPAGPIADLIDFRFAGPGTLPGLFDRVDAILATEDSSTMLSEAVCARLPVVGVAPASHAFKDEEQEYRHLLQTEGWIRTVPLARLAPDSFLEALQHVRPLAENHLDRLAQSLAERLPDLFVAP